MSNLYKLAAGSVIALSFLAVSPANGAVTYTTGTVVTSNLGATPGDVLTLGTATGSFTGAGTYTLNNASFIAAFFGAPPPQSGTVTDNITIGGILTTYTVPYNIVYGSLAAGDSITLGGNTFVANGFNFAINSLTLNSLGPPNAATPGLLSANVTSLTAAVPEPATWAMMLLGFGGIGVAMRRRRPRQIAQIA